MVGISSINYEKFIRKYKLSTLLGDGDELTYLYQDLLEVYKNGYIKKDERGYLTDYIYCIGNIEVFYITVSTENTIMDIDLSYYYTVTSESIKLLKVFIYEHYRLVAHCKYVPKIQNKV